MLVTAIIMMAGGKLELLVAMVLGVRSVVVVGGEGGGTSLCLPPLNDFIFRSSPHLLAAVGMDNHQLIGCTLGSVRYDFNTKKMEVPLVKKSAYLCPQGYFLT